MENKEVSEHVGIEAWQVGTEPVPEWIISRATLRNSSDRSVVVWSVIVQDNSTFKINEGDWIVKDGEFYEQFSREDFERKYEVDKG